MDVWDLTHDGRRVIEDRMVGANSTGRDDAQESGRMKTSPDRRPVTRAFFLLVAMAGSGPARAQEAKSVPAPRPTSPAIEAIHANYRGELQKLERRRLAQLGELAAGQPKA